MKRPDIDSIEADLEWEYTGEIDAKALIAYIRELEADNKLMSDRHVASCVRIVELLQETKTKEQETAFKCAYLAWQWDVQGHYRPEKPICDEYNLNLDSLYSTTWKELNK